MDRIPCPLCGDVHDLSDLQVGFAKPDAYFAVPVDERETRVKMTADLAMIDGKHGFIRGVLEIPVRGEPNPFGWGIWVRVERDVFDHHAYAGREGFAPVPPPAAGRIATQLPGYPQTLGVPVRVEASQNTTERPFFRTVDESHPLGVEQREGIHVERALEHLSRYLHSGATEPRGRPRFATLEGDGWELDDALARFHSRQGVNWLPDTALREGIRDGEAAKLIFAIEAAAVSGDPEVHRERMWVEVDHVAHAGAETLYSGAVTNDPSVPGLTRLGMRVWFHPHHVIDIAREDGWQASEDPDVLRCTRHGVSQTTYVCQHLPGGSGVGFNQADDPDNPRPDAWCDACDRVLGEEGEWTGRAEEAAKIQLLCASCYDAAEARNR